MRWLLRLLFSSLGWTADENGAGRSMDGQLDEFNGAAETDRGPAPRQGLGGGRTVERHRFGPPASADGLGWDTERLVYLDGSTQTVVEETVVRRCDCGVFLSYGNRAKGLCAVCGRVVCSDCHATCERCGALCCGTHAVRYGKHILCSRHRWVLYWLLFWGTLE